MLRLLIHAGAKINCHGCSVVASAVRSRKLEVVKYVLAVGADVNATEGYNQYTALMGSLHQTSKMVKLLLDAGADLFQENIQYQSVYMTAVWRRIKNRRILKLIEPAKPKLTDYLYEAGLYWGKGGPICENCLVWLQRTRTKEYEDVYKCTLENTIYVLKDGEYYREINS